MCMHEGVVVVENQIHITSQQETVFALEEELGFPSASRMGGWEFPRKLSPQCLCLWIAFALVSSRCMCDVCNGSSFFVGHFSNANLKIKKQTSQ